MSSQKIYVVFIFQVSIKYRICQLVIFKIKEKKYIYRAGDKTRLWLFVCVLCFLLSLLRFYLFGIAHV